MELVFIQPGDALYAGERDLRFRALREPFGMPRGSEEFPFEGESIHLVASTDQHVVGCVLFHPDGAGGGRLFQMAVDPAFRGRKVGVALVRAMEARLAAEGLREIHIHARDEAVGFYERLGYEIFGEPFVEIDISHRMMRKTLA